MKQRIKPEMIRRVYSGEPGCACGCRGNYSDSKRSVAMILKKYNETPEPMIETTTGIGEDGQIFYWDNSEGTRTYTIYLKRDPKVTKQEELDRQAEVMEEEVASEGRAYGRRRREQQMKLEIQTKRYRVYLLLNGRVIKQYVRNSTGTPAGYNSGIKSANADKKLIERVLKTRDF